MYGSGILFVSGANMGLSRMAEGLLRRVVPDVAVHSAGVDVDPDDRGLDEDARVAMREIGARCDGDPIQLTPSVADRHDRVIVLGDVDVSGHIAPDCDIVRWRYEDPVRQGVAGLPRYRILREWLRGEIRVLADDLETARGR
ncbi:arsenate reductase/protein-tyrosine-phosphatase family protein [Corynebacterium sp. 335C]